MSDIDIDKFYVSPYDKLFHGFDVGREKSASQIKEIEKHQRIARLRDDADAPSDDNAIWEDF